ncbi:hypothetical protein HMPREF1316_2524 [Olsenella profusa F0195]|uniref:Uncharacterized protein n=1 Tax=Olsenella profusa F0195 TaxID=1125712 RepID=U2TA78_9ACTN|nr:hypothetical protein HMPREF1316_2524 [Olsenella profusa F0195]
MPWARRRSVAPDAGGRAHGAPASTAAAATMQATPTATRQLSSLILAIGPPNCHARPAAARRAPHPPPHAPRGRP